MACGSMPFILAVSMIVMATRQGLPRRVSAGEEPDAMTISSCEGVL